MTDGRIIIFLYKIRLKASINSFLFPRRIYIDLFGVTSIDDVARRTAKGIYAVTQQNEPLFKKAVPKLSRLDLIEKSEENTWRIVDPLFEDWLKRI